jgi:hypothetical protein
MADRRTAGLADGEVEERLARLDDLLGRLEQIPGATAATALEAVEALTEVYGEALGRVVDAADPALVRTLAADDLVGHLLLLHGLHPDPVEERVGRALAEVKPYLGENGDAELTGIDAGVARIRVAASGCGSGEAAQSVADFVLGEAPELAGVESEQVRQQTLISAESLLRRPDGAP